MTALKVYITRPTAYEIYMGGKRDLLVWLSKPYYSHQGRIAGLDEDKYIDNGWRSAFSQGQRLKPLIDQDKKLLEAIWPHVFLSVCPKGMSYEDGIAWSNTPSPTLADPSDTLYRLLFSDKEWEGKCNTCHKRFLLELDLRTYEVQRIIPNVDLANLSDWVQTDQIDFKSAVQYYHDTDQNNIFPF